MFPYKSAVGLFVTKKLKALALIKAVAIYPVSCYIYYLVKYMIRQNKQKNGYPPQRKPGAEVPSPPW